MPPEECPNCGAEVPQRAKACPECGADEKTGWHEHAVAARLGIPEENFDYDDFIRSELHPTKPDRRRLRWYYWATALILVLALLGFLRFR